VSLALLAEYADFIFLLGGMVLNITAIPTLFNEDAHVSPITSGALVLVLILYTFTYLAMGLHLAAASYVLGTVIWAGIFYARR